MIVQSVDELNNLSFVNDFNYYFFSKIFDYRFSTSDKFEIKYFDKDASDLKLLKSLGMLIKVKNYSSLISTDFCSQKSLKIKNTQY